MSDERFRKMERLAETDAEASLEFLARLRRYPHEPYTNLLVEIVENYGDGKYRWVKGRLAPPHLGWVRGEGKGPLTGFAWEMNGSFFVPCGHRVFLNEIEGEFYFYAPLGSA